MTETLRCVSSSSCLRRVPFWEDRGSRGPENMNVIDGGRRMGDPGASRECVRCTTITIRLNAECDRVLVTVWVPPANPRTAQMLPEGDPGAGWSSGVAGDGRPEGEPEGGGALTRYPLGWVQPCWDRGKPCSMNLRTVPSKAVGPGRPPIAPPLRLKVALGDTQ